MSRNKYKGITTKTMSNGTTSIMVRFKHLGKTYPIKNFTKLFGCNTEKQAYEKLHEVKIMLSEGKDPFNTKGNTINDYFIYSVEKNLESGKWRPTTVTGYKNFYNAFIKKPIGHKKLDKVTVSDLEDIRDSKYLYGKSASYRNMLYRILNPFFKDAINRKEIYFNPCTILEHEQEDKKQKLEDRSPLSHLEIAQNLYIAFKTHHARYSHQRDELNMFFLLLLLSGHRQNEVLQIRREHCYLEEGFIISPKEITKTRIDYKFPIPEELKDWIASKHKGELLFPNMKLHSIYFQFQNILKYTPIRTFENKKISPHDMRSLMLNLMITKCGIDKTIADVCLEHKQPSVIEHYLNISFEDKSSAFYKYWDLIRDKKLNDTKDVIEQEVKDITLENSTKKEDKFDKLLKLTKLLEDDIITKEEFTKLKVELLDEN